MTVGAETLLWAAGGVNMDNICADVLGVEEEKYLEYSLKWFYFV